MQGMYTVIDDVNLAGHGSEQQRDGVDQYQGHANNTVFVVCGYEGGTQQVQAVHPANVDKLTEKLKGHGFVDVAPSVAGRQMNPSEESAQHQMVSGTYYFDWEPLQENPNAGDRTHANQLRPNRHEETGVLRVASLGKDGEVSTGAIVTTRNDATRMADEKKALGYRIDGDMKNRSKIVVQACYEEYERTRRIAPEQAPQAALEAGKDGR